MRKNITISDIRKNIIKKCNEKGISQRQCYINAGIEEHYFYNIEYLDKLPSLEKLMMISEYLDCTIDELLYGGDYEKCKTN